MGAFALQISAAGALQVTPAGQAIQATANRSCCCPQTTGSPCPNGGCYSTDSVAHWPGAGLSVAAVSDPSVGGLAALAAAIVAWVNSPHLLPYTYDYPNLVCAWRLVSPPMAGPFRGIYAAELCVFAVPPGIVATVYFWSPGGGPGIGPRFGLPFLSSSAPAFAALGAWGGYCRIPAGAAWGARAPVYAGPPYVIIITPTGIGAPPAVSMTFDLGAALGAINITNNHACRNATGNCVICDYDSCAGTPGDGTCR
jgi:hypothetical protein